MREGGGVISLHELKLDDSVGRSCFDLWYSLASIGDQISLVHSEAEVIKNAADYFMVASRKFEDVFLSTIICRSWKTRQKDGALRLLLPSVDTLFMK